MKVKAIVVGVCLGLALPSFNAGAQIPVTDVANLTNSIQNQVQNYANFVQQLQSLQHQIEQAQQQYDALTGTRGFGDLFNNPQLRNYLPAEWTGLYDAVQSGSVAGISGRVDDLIASTQAGSITDMSSDIAARRARLGAVNRATGEAGFEAAMQRTQQIQNLIEQIGNTQDPKAIAELQARIAGEQAAVANEMAKLQLVGMLQQAEERMLEARAEALFDKQMTGSNALPSLPTSF